MEFSFPCIGIVHSCFTDKFGIPRQPGLAPLAIAKIEILPPYDDINAFDGIETTSHLWIHWVFHANRRTEWKPRVKPPRLGGNKTLGVFATRSPTRPAPIGLSVVKFERLEQRDGKLFIHISGVDMLDRTPVLDIKPYVPYSDSLPQARNDFADAPPNPLLVTFSTAATDFCRDYQQKTAFDLMALVTQLLQQDPRPSYQTSDTAKNYAMQLIDVDIHWHYLERGIRVKCIHFIQS